MEHPRGASTGCRDHRSDATARHATTVKRQRSVASPPEVGAVRNAVSGRYCHRVLRAPNGDVQLAYETLGNHGDPAVILLHGLGSSLLVWDDELCWGLVDRGFFVVRMDHRDSGLSTVLEPGAVYCLRDMAGDVVAVLDHAGIGKAIVCGLSLGGMVAQTLAATHPGRVAGLVSVASNTGERGIGEPTDEARAALTAPAAASISEQIESDLVGYRIWANVKWRDEEHHRKYLERSYRRAWHPGASDRQFAAAARSGSRDEALRCLDVPALVIHGSDDPLVGPEAGRRTAELISGSSYLELEGMRHELSPQVWAPVISAITALSSRIAW